MGSPRHRAGHFSEVTRLLPPRAPEPRGREADAPEGFEDVAEAPEAASRCQNPHPGSEVRSATPCFCPVSARGRRPVTAKSQPAPPRGARRS